jgi:hypothetical protein
MMQLLKKINKRGLSWFLKRASLELRSPYYPVSKKIVFLIRKIKFFNLKPNKNIVSREGNILYAFYDLNIEPNTFGDFGYFLVDVEIFANQHGKKKIFLWIIPQEIKVQDDDYLKAVGEYNFEWRINNMLVPMISLHPAFVGHGVLPLEEGLNPLINRGLSYPENFSDTYRPRLPEFGARRVNYQDNLFRGLCAPLQAKKHISDWVKTLSSESKIISITLRNYNFDSSRNSNIKEWGKFADWLEQKGYKPVFIPDAESPWSQDNILKNHLIFNEPCWNVGLRMAMYEECALNYFYSNGCASIAVLNKNVASIVMMPIVEESVVSKEVNIMHDPELDPRRLGFAEQNQWWSTDKDTFENLTKDFLEYEKLYL